MFVCKYVGVNNSAAMLATKRRYCDINQCKTSSYPSVGSIDESVECVPCPTLSGNSTRTLPMFVRTYVDGNDSAAMLATRRSTSLTPGTYNRTQPMLACKYVGVNDSAAMLATRRSTSLTPGRHNAYPSVKYE